MADINVLMVTDGLRFNFGPPQASNHGDAYYFSLSVLLATLRNSTTPSISVVTAHRRRAGIVAAYPAVDPFIDYPEDFLFTGSAANPVDLSRFDVLWLIVDEGINGGGLAATDRKLTQAELLAIAAFMQAGGGVFAVGDHDGIGSYTCRRLPRIRTMRKWSYTSDTDADAGPDVTGQVFYGNWSAGGSAMSGVQDRFDTLRADAADGLFYFDDQADQTPQPVLTQSGAPITGANVIHTTLRGAGGAIIANFPDHMHEGEATDFVSVMRPGSAAFNPNQGTSTTPTKYALPDGTLTAYDEFPNVGGAQPVPEVIAWGQDLGHASLDPTVGVTNPKVRGILSVYDGRAAGVGRIMTGSTFHHYMDKNLIGDPMTSNPAGSATGPTGSDTGFQALPAILQPIKDHYINAVTWLCRQNPHFYFSTNKSTYGADEVATALAQHSTFQNAFYVIFDGIPPNVVGSNPAIVLAGPFAQGLGVTAGASIVAGNRVLVPFSISSIATSAFPSAGATAPNELTLTASVTLGSSFLFAETVMELVAGTDPYFTNVDPTAHNVFYLSQDLRVFTAQSGAAAPFVNFPANEPNTYITGVLNALNGDPSYTTGGADPFNVLGLGNDLQEDTSVDASKSFFALARVRLRPGGSTSPSVRVFFRLFATQTNDTDYAPETTYLSTYDTAGFPATPLSGAANSSHPMFATASSAGDYPGANTQPLTIPSVGESHTYFGCYLDFASISPPLPGTHHCLVAQIADDGAPLINSNGVTLSPENSDKLAQRNVQITHSGNPGGPAAHRVPQTFDTRPSIRRPARVTTLRGYPDELMIDWGDIPAGTTASIYWPDADALDIVRLASLLYAQDAPIASDAHTVQYTLTSRVTFVPIPFASIVKFAGLLTIDLPQGVRKGQEFHVVVRRFSTRQTARIKDAAGGAVLRRAALRGAATRESRYIVGTFQITIPVALEEHLLPGEENTLSIMKWRVQQTPLANRWYPVLKRYVAYLSGRVNAFGGNAGGIVASPVGLPIPGSGSAHGTAVEYSGKVCEVLFDCFGDFEGFVLDNCSESLHFRTRERAIGELALRACRERLLLTVVTEPGPGCRIKRLSVRC